MTILRRHTRRGAERKPNAPSRAHGPGGAAELKRRVDRYMALARDAARAGDDVAKENYFQHADHYTRLLKAAKATN